jgi:hypothetical protein
MKMNLRILALAVAAAALGWSSPGFTAASTVNQQATVCQGDVSGATTGTRTIGGTLSAVPSGTIYVLNGQGCALVAIGDVAYFLSQGYTQGSNLFSIQYAGVTSAASATTTQVGILPKGAVIMAVIMAETAGAAITGGVDIGKAASGTDFASAVALGANALITVADSALTRIVGTSGTTTQWPVYVTCHTSCNAGSITITILYSFM